MRSVNVYEQFFGAGCTWKGDRLHGADVRLTATSEEGTIRYEVTVNFFPYETPDDFRITYDACASEVLLYEKGRRSKKKDALCLAALRDTADRVAASLNGAVDWNRPLIEPKYG